ncbi:MAG: type II toxin-antitoxin system RelE/ParE family toxin [Opitutaceae bacterium]|nr:type II toxin-antitoxin system RelE/ParE family toxin [Cephaloticoccus sp.]MCP5529298.1 type II toxin-antitoxin system RelE/ParE family toxin [Opitutaceae bacterium]
MQIQVTSAAQRDLIEAYDWYENRSAGLGRALIQSVDTVFAFIRRHPTVPRIVLRDLRCVHAKRFPYAIYYQIRECHTARIVAVLHTSRDRIALIPRL